MILINLDADGGTGRWMRPGCIDNVRNVCASMTPLTNCLFVF